MHIKRAHALYADDEGHAGLIVTMCRGSMMSVHNKLDLVTSDSSETKIASNTEIFTK